MMVRSSPAGNINISATARKIDVDNRISLPFYYRIADNILKQADIFREEKNVIDLYVMLLRFSSLVTETIPCHRDYRTSSQGNKLDLKRKSITAVTELEELKPVVQAKLQELHNRQQLSLKNDNLESSETSVEWPRITQNRNDYSTMKRLQPATSTYGYQARKSNTLTKPVDGHTFRLSNIPRPKEETLSKHSILGPNGLRGQWQPPTNYKLQVQYPSNLDFTPLQIQSSVLDPFRDINKIQHSVKDETVVREEDGISEKENSSLESVIQSKTDGPIQDSDSLISFETVEIPSQTEILGHASPLSVLAGVQDLIPRQPSPPPVLAEIQDLIPTSNSAAQVDSGLENTTSDSVVCSEDPLELHISTDLMNSFLKMAKSNTDKNLETCGILAGSLKNRKFYLTALIIPKQESTSDSCQATNEEEIFDVQDKRSLFPLGWIHTHPTQSCFMSSIDIHTHYSYQIMLPEAIAIVMAPKDSSRTHGIFRLTSGGMTVIRHCPRRGFHAHDPPSDGSPIYRHCSDVYMNAGLKVDVIDLR